MTTPTPPSVSVNTANGNDYVVPGGQSWATAPAPTGELHATVFDGPWMDGVEQGNPTGSILASFSDVEAIFQTGKVTVNTP